MDDVVITRRMMGIAGMQVCVKKSVCDKEILRVANAENPCGTEAGWCSIIRQNTEKRKNIAPVDCDDYSDRVHLLLTC